MGRKCTVCENYLTVDDRVISKTMLGSDTERFYCIGCLADFLLCDTAHLERKLEWLRNRGCDCFEEERAYLIEAAIYDI